MSSPASQACFRYLWVTFVCRNRAGFLSAARDLEPRDVACRENHRRQQCRRAMRESAGVMIAPAVLTTQHEHVRLSPGIGTVETRKNERVAMPT